MFCSGESHIEFAGVFLYGIGIVLGEESRITVIIDIKDDDIVKLKSFRLMHCGHKHPLVYDVRRAEVTLLECRQLKNMRGDLRYQVMVLLFVHQFASNIAEHILHVLHRLDYSLAHKIGIEITQFDGKQRFLPALLPFVQTAQCGTIKRQHLAAHIGSPLPDSSLRKEFLLAGYSLLCPYVTVFDYIHRRSHVGIGKMTVHSFQRQHLQEIFQFVLMQLWFEKSGEFQ